MAVGPIDVDRIIFYSFFTEEGLTLDRASTQALIMFLTARFYIRPVLSTDPWSPSPYKTSTCGVNLTCASAKKTPSSIWDPVKSSRQNKKLAR